MGCEGVLTQSIDNNGVPNYFTIREWAKQDSNSEDRAIFWLENNLLKYKQFIFKDAKTTCIPDIQNWQKLTVNMTYDQVRTILECGDGTLQMLYTTSDDASALQSVYTWKNVLMDDNGNLPIGGISYQFGFVGGKLQEKEYTNSTQPFSTCTPTEIGLNNISIGKSWTSIENQQAMGCSPSLSYALVNINGGAVKQYSWGTLVKDAVTTRAYVSVDAEGIVRGKYISLTPPTSK
jgi:hypothetical protein